MRKTIRPTSACLALLAALAALSAACTGGSGGRTGAKRDAPRGIVVVAVAGLRSDKALPPSGSGGPPELTRLASEGASVRDCASTAPMLRPALASLLTGIGPDRLGTRDDLVDPLPPDAPTIAAALKERGFTTAAFFGSPFLREGSGFGRGFDIVDARATGGFGPERYMPKATPAGDVAKDFQTWIGTVPPERSFFALVELSDLAATADRGTVDEGVAAYATSLEAVDRAVGTIAAALSGRADVDLVVVGTHGLALGEDGARGDAFWLTAQTLDVPLIWVGPHATEIRGDHRPVWLPDVAATIADLAGLPLPASADGISLRKPAEAARTILAWTWAPDDDAALPPRTAWLADGRWTSVASDAPQAAPPGVRARLAAPRARALPDAVRKRLVAAGFEVTSALPSRSPALPDPTPAFSQLWRVRATLADGKALPTIRGSFRLLKDAPDNLGALLFRLWVLNQTQGTRLRARMAEKLVKLYPDRAEALHYAGHALYANKDYAKALVLFRAAGEVGPVEPEVAYDVACMLALQGKKEAALDQLDAAIREGFREFDIIENDPDLASVRGDARYTAILKSHGRSG